MKKPTLKEMQQYIADKKGVYGGRRFERAHDEIPNLLNMYELETLMRAFTGDNAKALMTMDPSKFEDYAIKLGPDESSYEGGMSYDQYIRKLGNLVDRGGFADVPFLEVNKRNPDYLPNIEGHEGRHRSRALTARGIDKSLVQLFPNGNLKDLPRRSQEDFIEALKKELGEKRFVSAESKSLLPSDPNAPKYKMLDEKGLLHKTRPMLPDVYAEGGGIPEHMREHFNKNRAPELAKFLKNSAIKDRLYHGTTDKDHPMGIGAFKPSSQGKMGAGVYLTPSAKMASKYAEEKGIGGRGAYLLPTHAKMRNPITFTQQDNGMVLDQRPELFGGESPYGRMTGEEIQAALIKAGYDSAIIRDQHGNVVEANVFHPSHIKSAIGNRGTYDVKDPDITKNRGGKVKSTSQMRYELLAKGGKVDVRPTVQDPNLQRRIPEIESAARAFQSGEMSKKDYDKIVKKHKPVKPYDFIPKPASDEDAKRALMTNKQDKWRNHESWPEGHKVGLRLDIPAYENHGVWVNSIHDETNEKRPTSYGPVSSVKNAEFDPNPHKGIRVATGEQNKAPFARIIGNLHHMHEDEAVENAKEYLNHPEWTQVGYDPRRHGYFYDRKTMKPVSHAEHVIQIGPLVLAKNVKHKKADSYADGGKVKRKSMNEPTLDEMRLALSKQERRANRKKFLEPSKEKRRLYHGSKEPNITEFKTRKELHEENYPEDTTGHYADKRDAVYLSPDPKFTRHFSVEGYTDTGQAPTTYPVHVQARNPFDFDKPSHRENLWKTYHDIYYNPESELYAHGKYDLPSEKTLAEMRMKKRILESHKDDNNWSLIESPNVQEAIKDMGHDSFYINERGTKNLGVYDPRKIKSAIGNRGTYDVNDPDITKAEGGNIQHKDLGGAIKGLATANNISRLSDVPYIFDAINSAKTGNYGDLIGSAINAALPIGPALATYSADLNKNEDSDLNKHRYVQGHFGRQERTWANGLAKGGIVSMLRKHGRPVDSEVDAMKKMSNGHRVFIVHEQDEQPREITSVSEMHGYVPDWIYTIDPKHFMQHKAIGGTMQPQSEPTLAQMRLEIARHSNPAVMNNIGVNEAVDINPKIFVNPNPNSSGLPDVGGVKTSDGALPIGGVDVNPMMKGTQFMPQQPQQQPPQGQQSPFPSMAPAGSSMPQSPSNILNLTPQGQAMSAIRPPMTPNMAKGGSIHHFAEGGSEKEKPEESKRILVNATGPNGIKGIVIPRHMLEGKTYSGTGPKAGQKVEGLIDLNKARAEVYGSENRQPLNIGQMGRIHRQVLNDHFAKPIDEQIVAEKEALERLRKAKHIGKNANTLDESEKLDTVRHETDDQGRTHVGYAAKGIAGHALYSSGIGKNEKLHVLNTCPGQVDGCGGGIDKNGIVDTKRGSCFAPNAESQYVNAAVRRAAHAQAKHDPAMTRDWVLAHTGSLREAADEADKNNQRLLFRPNVVDESDTSSRYILRGLNEQRKKDKKPCIIANSYGKTNELHDPENCYHVTHSNVGPKTKHGKEINDSIQRDKARVRNTILARDNQGDFVNEQGNKTPPKNSYMVTNVKRGSPFDKAMQNTITHAKYWSTPRPLNELTEMEKDEGSEGHYDGKGKPTTPDKSHYGHMVIGNNRYDYQKQHILHPRLVQVGTNKDGTPHMIPTDSRFLDNKELDKKIPQSKQFKTKNGKRAGLILMTTPTESTPNHEHHSSFTHDVSPMHLEYAKKNNGEYEIDPPLAQEFARGKEYVAPQPMKMVKKTWATGGSVHSSLKQLNYNDNFNAFPETNFASQHHLAKRLATTD